MSRLTELRREAEELTGKVDGLRAQLDSAVKKRRRVLLDIARLEQDSSAQLLLYQEDKQGDNVGISKPTVQRV